MRSFVCVLIVTCGVACTAKDSGTTAQSDTTSTAATSPTPASSTETAITSTETAVAPEVNPPGDIPDSQAFVAYKNTTGAYQVEVPEGWSRTASQTSADVTFVHIYDGVSVHVFPAPSPPTVASVRAKEVKQIASNVRAVKITGISEETLASGAKAVAIKYTSNSNPSAITNKQVRLENVTYILYKNGKEAMLTMWAPVGADNVDQWNRMANSFRWL